VLLPYYIRMFTNILFLFLVDSGLGDLEFTLRTLEKGNYEGDGVLYCFFIM